MKVIKVIIDHMNDTLKEARDYYKDYVMYKDEFPKVAQTAIEMAQNHMNLYMRWHDVVVNLINDYKIKKGEIPPQMKELYDYEHRRLTEYYEELNFKIRNKI